MTRVSRLIMNGWHNHAKMWFMWRAITTRRCFAGWKEEWRGSKLLDGIGFMTVRRHAVLRGLRLVRGWHLWALRCGQRRKRLLGVEGRIARRSGIRVKMMVFGSWRDLMLRSVYVKQRIAGPKGSTRLLFPPAPLGWLIIHSSNRASNSQSHTPTCIYFATLPPGSITNEGQGARTKPTIH
jgi:hypothetical protein